MAVSAVGTGSTRGPSFRPSGGDASTSSTRRADIQGLRAVAILFVVAFHAGLPVPGGFVGVDVFFVISGFVITAMLLREWRRSRRIRFGTFYFRRFKRLTPALALVVSVTVLAAPLLLSPVGPTQNLAATAAGAMLLVANIVIARTTGDYFDLDAELNPLLHTWSLSLEEQFYLFFPILLVVALVAGRRSSLRLPWPALLVAGLVAVSFLAATGTLPVDRLPESLLGFYGPLTRVWEFGVGALVALAWDRLPQLGTRLGTLAGAVGATLLFVSLFAIGPETPWPGVATLMPVTGTALLIYAGSAPSNQVSAVMGTRPLVRIGDISYSWYLWHWPLIVYAALIWPASPWVPGAAALLSLIPAVVSYRLVERPIRAMGPMPRALQTRLVAATVLPPLGLAGLLAVAVDSAYWHPEVSRYQEAVLAEPTGWPTCHSGVIRDDCLHNKEADGSPVFLVGDSHAIHFADALLGAAIELDRPLTLLPTVGCSFIAGQTGQCGRFYDARLRVLQGAPTGTVVIANAWWQPDALDPSLTNESSLEGAAREAAAGALGVTVNAIEAMGHTAVIVQTVPRFALPPDEGGHYPPRCTNLQVIAGDCSGRIAEEQALARQTQSRRIVTDVVGSTSAAVVDLWPVLCRNGWCDSDDGVTVRYRDQGHLTVPASEQLAPVFTEALKG